MLYPATNVSSDSLETPSHVPKMAPGPIQAKSKAKTKDGSKGGDSPRPTVPETPGFNPKFMTISPNILMWGTFHTRAIAIAGVVWRRLCGFVWFVSSGEYTLVQLFGSSSRPTLPTHESFSGFCYGVSAHIPSYSYLKRGMVVDIR